MRINYILVLSLILLISTSILFFTSNPINDDSLDSEKCNCSGPKALNSELNKIDNQETVSP